MIHLYCGDGKGKTTAAMGLALRMAGREQAVVVAQFLKGGESGERKALALLPGVTLLPVPEQVPFTVQMTREERREECRRCHAMLKAAQERVEAGRLGLLVLDEVCDAVNAGLLSLEDLLTCLEACDKTGTEVVLTGRNPAKALVDRADYHTCMEKARHPFDRGIPARLGVEV